MSSGLLMGWPRDPLDRVVAVLPLVVVKRELSRRAELFPAILRDEDVARFGKALARGFLLGAIIRRAGEDDGSLFDRVIAIEIGGELHAIAHRDGDDFRFDLGEDGGGEDE